MLLYLVKTTILAKSPWDTLQKHVQDWTFVKNALPKSVALFIPHWFWSLPSPSSPSNVESVCNDSGCEERFKSTLHSGWTAGMREFNLQCFCESVPRLLARIVYTKVSSRVQILKLVLNQLYQRRN